MENKLKSGSEIVDELLEGGYDSNIITTIYGPAGSGKTTFCLLASIAIADSGKKVIFMDTEGGFSIRRFNQLTDNKDLLNSIFILKPIDFFEQKKAIERLKNMMNEQIGLVVIDTIGYHYRIEMGKKHEIKQINNELGLQISFLSEIARKYNIPVLLTNQVYSDFDEKSTIRIVGGDLLKYASKCLMELQKGASGIRIAVVKKHRSIAEGKEIKFRLVEKGIGSIE